MTWKSRGGGGEVAPRNTLSRELTVFLCLGSFFVGLLFSNGYTFLDLLDLLLYSLLDSLNTLILPLFYFFLHSSSLDFFFFWVLEIGIIFPGCLIRRNLNAFLICFHLTSPLYFYSWLKGKMISPYIQIWIAVYARIFLCT